jgi:hypothetical protein
MQVAVQNGRNGTTGGPGVVVVDCGIVGTSLAIVELECCSSTALNEVRLGQCWV